MKLNKTPRNENFIYFNAYKALLTVVAGGSTFNSSPMSIVSIFFTVLLVKSFLTETPSEFKGVISLSPTFRISAFDTCLGVAVTVISLGKKVGNLVIGLPKSMLAISLRFGKRKTSIAFGRIGNMLGLFSSFWNGNGNFGRVGFFILFKVGVRLGASSSKNTVFSSICSWESQQWRVGSLKRSLFLRILLMISAGLVRKEAGSLELLILQGQGSRSMEWDCVAGIEGDLMGFNESSEKNYKKVSSMRSCSSLERY